MFIGLRIFVTAVSVYAGVRLAGVAIEWVKELVDNLGPEARRKKKFFDNF